MEVILIHSPVYIAANNIGRQVPLLLLLSVDGVFVTLNIIECVLICNKYNEEYSKY